MDWDLVKFFLALFGMLLFAGCAIGFMIGLGLCLILLSAQAGWWLVATPFSYLFCIAV